MFLASIDEDEEEHGLYVAPHIAEFSSLKGGASRHLMTNGTERRLAIKIKCSNNSLFRVSPVYYVLESGDSQRMLIVRDPGKPAVDKLILLYKPTNCKNAYDAFNKEDGEPVKKTMIALIAKQPPVLASFDEFTSENSRVAPTMAAPTIAPPAPSTHPLLQAPLKPNLRPKPNRMAKKPPRPPR